MLKGLRGQNQEAASMNKHTKTTTIVDAIQHKQLFGSLPAFSRLDTWQHGITYAQCEQNKSELYLAFIPVTNSGGVELPDDKRLFNQLRRLERKRGRAGKDTVDHASRNHDDLANAVARCFLPAHQYQKHSP